MTNNLMTTKEVAAYLRLNYMTIYQLVRRGSIPASKLGGNWRFQKELVGAWLTQQENQT